MTTINSVGNGLSGNTGTGSFVGSTSATLTTPAIGTPSSGNLSNCTALPLTTGVSGVLPLANGGSNANLTASDGGVIYSTSTAMAVLAPSFGNKPLLSALVSGSPHYSGISFPDTLATNSILYSTSANVISALNAGANQTVVTDGSNVITFSSTLPSAVQGNITSVGTITSGTWNGTDVAVTAGGTGASTATNARTNLGIAWELVGTATASSSASVSFTDLSSTYSSYMLVLKDVLPATDSVNFILRTSSNNGSSYDSAGTDYFYLVNSTTYGSSQVSTNANAGFIQIGSGTTDNVSTTNGTVMIMSHTGANPCHIHSSINSFEASAGVFQIVEAYGFRNGSSAVDAVQILFSSGNIASGDFYLYGLKASTVS